MDNNTLIPISRQLAADMAAAARIEDRRQRENQRAMVIFVMAAITVAWLAAFLLG